MKNILEELDLQNKKIEDNFKVLNEAILLQSENGRGYFLNGNYVESLNVQDDFSIYSDEEWKSNGTYWLSDDNAQWKATYIEVENDLVYFKGQWSSGEFRGVMFGNGSTIIGGIFNGISYESPNRNFKITPDKFYSGKYKDNQNGILGLANLTVGEIQNIDELQIIQLPVGWGVELTDDAGVILGFEIVKRIDDTDSSYIFRKIPSREEVNVDWEIIRKNYGSNGIISKGKHFGLFGNTFGNVKTIKVTTSPSSKVSLNQISLSTKPIEAMFKKLNIGDFNFEIKPTSEDGKRFVTQFLKDLSNGTVEGILKSLRAKVENGSINGYGEFEFLAPVFRKQKGDDKLDEVTKSQMKYLNDMVNHLSRGVEPINLGGKSIEFGKILVEMLTKTLTFVKKRKPKEITVKQKPEEKNQNVQTGHPNAPALGGSKKEREQAFINKVKQRLNP